MKIRTRILCLLLAGLTVFTAAPQAFADVFEVGNDDQLASSWETASSNSDTQNTFNMTNDINMGGHTLVASEGKDYTINGNGNTLSNVDIVAKSNPNPESKQPDADVAINADITSGNGEAALNVSGTVDVGVNGDVTSTSGGTAVSATNGADVTVDNVINTDGGIGVAAHEASVLVNGDVTMKGADDSSTNFAVTANDATVVVGDDVVSDTNGIAAHGGNTTVYVKGDVTVKDSGLDPIMTEGFRVEAGADLKVNGNVSSHGTSNIIGDTETSTVTIKGNFTSEEGGLRMNNGSLTVNGDVSLNNQIIIQNSDVEIKGDFTGVPADGVTQNGGIYVADGSKLNMGEGTTLESDQLHIFGDSLVDADKVESNAVTVGLAGGIANDKSQLLANEVSCGNGDSYLNTGGSSYTRIDGETENIYATNNSRVDVIGSAKNVEIHENAVVITNIGNSKADVQASGSNNSITSGTKDDVLVKLSQEYGNINRTMTGHIESLAELRHKVLGDVNSLVTVGNTIGIVVTQFVDIDASLLTPFMGSDYTDENLYHPDSVAAFKKTLTTKNVSTYEYPRKVVTKKTTVSNLNAHSVNMYRELLGNALEDAGDAIALKGYTSNEMAFAQYLAQELAGLEPPKYLKGAARKYIGKTDLTASEMEDLLNIVKKENAYNSEFNEDIARYMIELTGMGLSSSKELGSKALGFVMEDLFTCKEFIDYWMTDFGPQIQALDILLKEQYMEPEMFYAAAELRTQYVDKVKGTMQKMAETAVKKGIEYTLDKFDFSKMLMSVAKAGSPVIDVVTGSKELYAAISSTGVLLEASTAYENAIKKVQNGDHSEEAIDMVYVTFSMYKNSLETMCDAMIKNGTSKQKTYYKNMKKELNALGIGEILPV